MQSSSELQLPHWGKCFQQRLKKFSQNKPKDCWYGSFLVRCLNSTVQHEQLLNSSPPQTQMKQMWRLLPLWTSLCEFTASSVWCRLHPRMDAKSPKKKIRYEQQFVAENECWVSLATPPPFLSLPFFLHSHLCAESLHLISNTSKGGSQFPAASQQHSQTLFTLY